MSTDNVEEMIDEQVLRRLLDESDDFDFRRRIRARLRQLKKDAPAAAVENDKLRSKDVPFVRVQKTTTTPVEKPRLTKQTENGSKEFIQKSTNLRSTSKTGETTKPPPSSQSGMKLEAVSLRSSPRINEPRKAESSGGKVETVVLRKVTPDLKTTEPAKSRSSASKLTPKSAFERFKEMDLNSEAGQKYLESGERGARRRSPSPNSIRDQMLNWCRARTACYDDIELDDFSTSWSDGMAFCALVHSFYPEAFDYDALDRKDKAKNFQLAFDTAEKLAGVFPLLDVEDMVRTNNPDWKCVFTYVNCFANRMSEIRRERKNAEMQELEKEQQQEREKEQEGEEEEEEEEEEKDSD